MTEEKNRRLLRNLTLLEGIMGVNGTFLQIHLDELLRKGFDPNSVTGVIFNEHGYRLYCYHFSYTVGADGILHVLRHAKVDDVLPGFYERWTVEFPDDVRLSRRERRKRNKTKKTGKRTCGYHKRE